MGLTINQEKTEMMKVGKWNDNDKTVINDREVLSVDAFALLVIGAAESSCNIEIKIPIGKTNAACGRLTKIWKKNKMDVI